MSDKEVSVQVGPGFLGLLTLLFITLKLTGYISWPWLAVLAPLWLPLAIVLALFIAFAAAALLVIGVLAIISYHQNTRLKK